ncbi:OmpH family outer membrane protein [Acidobacteria bacterium AH-259-A15]|nr:OmpH family outer membrane protein [Acidobacteria bacterium AH-259-A15]
MRERTAVIFVLLITFGVSTLISLGQNVKIGFINTLEVLNSTEEGKRKIGELNQFASQKQQQIASQTTELQKLQEQYATQQRTLNPETRAEMERTIQDKDRTLKRLQEDIQLEFTQRRDELLGRMSEKIRVIIDEYAPKNGYAVIFLRDQTQTYVDPSLDITQDIIKIYNEQNPVASEKNLPPAP